MLFLSRASPVFAHFSFLFFNATCLLWHSITSTHIRSTNQIHKSEQSKLTSHQMSHGLDLLFSIINHSHSTNPHNYLQPARSLKPLHIIHFQGQVSLPYNKVVSTYAKYRKNHSGTPCEVVRLKFCLAEGIINALIVI